ncbi:MAG: FAD-binding oxidoreductase [Pseudomonadota bacterium]
MENSLFEIFDPAFTARGTDAAKWQQDWTGALSWDPACVVRPGSTQEVAQIMRWASATQTPIVPVSGNTGLAGGTKADGAVMLSLDRLDSLDISPRARTAEVGAGVILSDLHTATETHDLLFPMTFGAKGSAMLGGMLATNAGGSNVLRYGNTRDLCLGLEVVLPNGEIMNLMSALHKDNTGLDLRNLFIGAEGTLGVITKAVLKLVAQPKATATAFVATDTLNSALSLLRALQEATSNSVDAFEFMEPAYLEALANHDPKQATPLSKIYPVNILLEISSSAPRDTDMRTDGTVPLTELLETMLAGFLEKGALLDAVVAQSDAQKSAFWERRELAAEVTFAHPGHCVNHDVAVAPERVQDFTDAVMAALRAKDPGVTSLIVAHLGDGNVHLPIFPTHEDPAHCDALTQTIEDVVEAFSGSFSAEHGVGIKKRNTLERRKDPVALAAMVAIKRALDPLGIMNPGKVFDGLTGS